jgi:hypothetical protein
LKDRTDWAQEFKSTPIAPTAKFYAAASKRSRKWLVTFTGFATVNKEMPINILGHLRDAVRRKCHEKWRTNSWFLLYDNAPAHRSVLVMDILAKNDLTTLQHSHKHS